MDAFIYLIPITVLFVLVMLFALLWNIKNSGDQDLEKESSRIIFFDEESK